MYGKSERFSNKQANLVEEIRIQSYSPCIHDPIK